MLIMFVCVSVSVSVYVYVFVYVYPRTRAFSHPHKLTDYLLSAMRKTYTSVCISRMHEFPVYMRSVCLHVLWLPRGMRVWLHRDV